MATFRITHAPMSALIRRSTWPEPRSRTCGFDARSSARIYRTNAPDWRASARWGEGGVQDGVRPVGEAAPEHPLTAGRQGG